MSLILIPILDDPAFMAFNQFSQIGSSLRFLHEWMFQELLRRWTVSGVPL